MTDYTNPLLTINAGTPSSNQPKNGTTWFQAMSEAWGQALDGQATRIEEQSNALNAGDDSPSRITRLTTEALKMSFLSSSSHTAVSSIGSSLETLARKQ